MTLDLTAARVTAGTTLTATCTITRDAEGHGDDVLNTTTGALVPPDPDTATVYAGACTVRPVSRLQPSEEGGADVYRYLYRVLLPITVEPDIGDLVSVTAAGDDGDPSLVGRTLVITEVAYSSRAVLRRAVALDRREGPRT